MTHPIALQELLDTIECGEEHDTAADHLAAIRQAAKAVRATPPLRDWLAGQALIAIAQDPLAEVKALVSLLQTIHDDANGYADGAPDASSHDKLCAQLVDLTRPLLSIIKSKHPELI